MTDLDALLANADGHWDKCSDSCTCNLIIDLAAAIRNLRAENARLWAFVRRYDLRLQALHDGNRPVHELTHGIAAARAALGDTP